MMNTTILRHPLKQWVQFADPEHQDGDRPLDKYVCSHAYQ